jgi:hypothetical protein
VTNPAASGHGDRVPPKTDSHAVWLSHRFCRGRARMIDHQTTRSDSSSFTALFRIGVVWVATT